MGETFHVALPVRFADVDYARVMYFPRILDLAHVAMEEFFERGLGRSYAHMIEQERLGFPTVHLDVSFRRPLRFGERADFAVSVAELGTKKLVLRYAVDVAGARCVDLRQTTVAIDPFAFSSIEIPPAYRDALRRYLVLDPGR